MTSRSRTGDRIEDFGLDLGWTDETMLDLVLQWVDTLDGHTQDQLVSHIHEAAEAENAHADLEEELDELDDDEEDLD